MINVLSIKKYILINYYATVKDVKIKELLTLMFIIIKYNLNVSIKNVNIS